MNRQLIKKAYRNLKTLNSLAAAAHCSNSHKIQTPSVYAQRSITTLNFFNPLHQPRSFWQFYSQNHSIADFNAVEQASTMANSEKKLSTEKSGTQKLENNSHINTRNHVYYEKYSIPGFNPIVYTLPKEPKSTKKVSTMKGKGKEVVVENFCHIKTCNHAYYEEFSIAGFNPIDPVPTPVEISKGGPAIKVESQYGTLDGDDLDPYNHIYYQNYSIAGFKPSKIILSSQLKSTQKPTTTRVEISKDRALGKAAADRDIDCEINTCAQTLESLEWERLGIVGFRHASDDMKEDEVNIEVEKVKDEENPVQSREGVKEVFHAGFPVVCLFMGIF